MSIRLSPSTLSVYRDCPRCFWHTHNRDAKRPEGIFPSLPRGIDKVMKQLVEDCIVSGRPVHYLDESDHLPELRNAVPFPDRLRLKKWQNWRTGPMVELTRGSTQVTLSGAVDDALLWPDGKVSAWDFKSRMSPPKEGDSEKYYGSQLDIYTLLMRDGAKVPVTSWGYLTYVWPVTIDKNNIAFDHQTVPIGVDPERAMTLALDAAECLQGREPPASSKCEYCTFIENRKEIRV